MFPSSPLEAAPSLSGFKFEPLLDALPEKAFSSVLALVAQVLGVPLVLVVLTQQEKLWIQAVHGLNLDQIQQEVDFPDQILLAETPILVTDTAQDDYFDCQPLTVAETTLRGFAGVPLHSSDGHKLGLLCVADPAPRHFSQEQQTALTQFAALIVQELELRLATLDYPQLETRTNHLQAELDALYDASNDAIFIFDRQGCHLKIASPNTHLLCKPADELVGKTLHEVFPQAQADNFLSLIHYALDHNQTISADYSLQIQGEEVCFTANFSPLGTDAVICVARDVTEQQQAEEAMAQSVAQIRLIMDSVPARIAYVDREHHYRFVNRQYEEWFRLPAEEIVGKHVRELLGEPIFQGIRPYAEAVLAGEQVTHEDSLISADGEEHFFYVVYVPHFGESEVLGYYVLIQDITERKRAEQILRESEARFRQLIQDLQVGVLLQGPDAEILVCNQAAVELLGLTESQLLGKTSYDPDWNVIHEDGSPFPGEQHPVPQAIATGKPVCNVVMGVSRPQGEDRVWLLVHAEPQFKPDGNLKQIVCTFSDITERKRAQEALAQKEARFRALVQNSSDMIVVVDASGTKTFVSPSVERILGYQPEELLGKNAFELVHDDDLAVVQTAFGNTLQSPTQCVRVEFRFCHASGHWVDLECVGRNLLEEPSIQGIVVNIWDVSESKARLRKLQQAEEKLRQAEATLQQLNEDLEGRVQERTAELAQVNAQLQSEIDQRSRTAKALEESEARFRRVLELTAARQQEPQEVSSTATSFNRNLATGKITCQPIPLNLKAYCQSLLDQLTAKNGGQPPLILVCSEERWNVCLDEKLLWHILINLLTNAIKYSPADSPVQLELSQAGEDLCLRVQDQGIGIPVENLPQVFDSFYRGSNVGSTPGAGLGLAIAQRCAQIHGGQITVDSQENQGTTFTVMLPIRPEPPLGKVHPVSHPSAGN